MARRRSCRSVPAQSADTDDEVDGDDEGDENEERGHGRNYASIDFVPPVAGLTITINFLPY
jgi:hypothetical protein